MPVTINGNGSITGLSVGGLGSGVVNEATIADGAVTQAKRNLVTGEVLQTVHASTTDSNVLVEEPVRKISWKNFVCPT